MARYEGMEELLQRVRLQLKVDESAPAPLGTDKQPGVSAPQGEEQYASTLEALLLLMRDAEQFQALLSADRIRELTAEQSEDLSRLLTRLLRRLHECDSALHQD